MTNPLSVKPTQVVDLLLDSNQQEALNEQCKRVISLLGSSFTNKVDAIRELESIRWTGDWTKDEFWNRLKSIDGYSEKQLSKIPRDWVTYIDLVRQFRIEGEPISKSTYNRLVTAGALIDAINYRNAHSPDPSLPLPNSPGQCEPFMALLKRSDHKRDLDCFAPDFRRKIESVDSLGVNTNPYAPPVQQDLVLKAWSDCWDSLPSDKQYDHLNRPQPPSHSWSKKVLKKSQTEVSDNGQINSLPSSPVIDASVRAAQVKRNEESAKEFREMMNQIREREADSKVRSEQERLADEIRRRESKELDEIKAYVREYSFSINDLLQASQNLLIFLRKLSNLKGTRYLSEMRAFDLGIISCRDDVQRFQLLQERVGEIFTLASSSNPPAGVDMTTIDID